MSEESISGTSTSSSTKWNDVTVSDIKTYIAIIIVCNLSK